MIKLWKMNQISEVDKLRSSYRLADSIAERIIEDIVVLDTEYGEAENKQESCGGWIGIYADESLSLKKTLNKYHIEVEDMEYEEFLGWSEWKKKRLLWKRQVYICGEYALVFYIAEKCENKKGVGVSGGEC